MRAKMTDNQKEKECATDRDRKRKKRDERSFEEWSEDCKLDAERKRKQVDDMDEVEREFRRIDLKHKKRSLRKQRTGKEKLQQNLKAKKGMSLLRDKGRLISYKERVNPKGNEIDDWISYKKKGKKYLEKLDEMKPDIVAKINEQVRKEDESRKEIEAKKKIQIEEDGGEWIYNAEFDDYQWVGEGDPQVNNDPVYEPLTTEQLAEIRRQEEELLQAEIEKERKLREERRRQKQDQLKKAMKTPIPPFPEKEMCEYEKLRERNINERKKVMQEAGFYDDLNGYKQEIGLIATNDS